MNAEDRNVSGSSRKMLSPMMLSRCRTSMPSALDSAPNTVPSRTEATTSTTGPARRRDSARRPASRAAR